MGPHPAVAEVRRAVRASLAKLVGPDALTPDAAEQRVVLVACSGGADSVALAAATAFEASRCGISAGLVTVDHGLQAGSDRVAADVSTLGYELGLDPVVCLPVRVGRRGGPESAARDARYQALDACAEAMGAHILLGHTLDDQAETVLLGLGRGSGPRSIAGMRELRGRYLRPLLGVRRATTRAACEALTLPVWDDPHNDDPRYRRVRLRREVLPLLDDVVGGGVVEALARTAAQVQADLDALDGSAAWELAHRRRADGRLDVDGLDQEPGAIRTRVLRGWALGRGVTELTATHIDALDCLVTGWHGQGPVDLPGGFGATRASGTLSLSAPQS